MKTRIVTAAAVLVSAWVHWSLWRQGFRDFHMVGSAFLLNAVAGLVIGVALVAWRHWIPPLLAVGFGVSTLAAFVTAATVGLFGVSEVWTGWAVWTAAVSELVAIAAGVTVLWQEYRREPQPSASVRSEVHH